VVFPKVLIGTPESAYRLSRSYLSALPKVLIGSPEAPFRHPRSTASAGLLRGDAAKKHSLRPASDDGQREWLSTLRAYADG